MEIASLVVSIISTIATVASLAVSLIALKTCQRLEKKFDARQSVGNNSGVMVGNNDGVVNARLER